MARAHTVEFTSSVCTTRLTFDSEAEAQAWVAVHWTTGFWTVCGIHARYVGLQEVRKRKPKKPLRPPLTLEDVPIVALFDTLFPCHVAMARLHQPGYVPSAKNRTVAVRIHKVHKPDARFDE